MQDTKDWKSQSQATYRSSQQCAKDPALYNERPVAGIRTRLVCSTLAADQCLPASPVFNPGVVAQQEMEAMLAEASTVAEAAPLPPQSQTNYREEFQYCGPTTVRCEDLQRSLPDLASTTSLDCTAIVRIAHK